MIFEELDLLFNDISKKISSEPNSERVIQLRIINELRKKGIYAHSLPDSSVGTKEFDFFFYFKKQLFLVELKRGNAGLRKDQQFTIDDLQNKFREIIYIVLRFKDGKLSID